jgi:hypothetical protein
MVGNPKNGSLKKNSAPRIFFRPMGEINNIFNDIGTIQLTCIIHESFGFMNKHPQQIKSLCCEFRQGASHPLKVSPERRPVKAGVEARRADYS